MVHPSHAVHPGASIRLKLPIVVILQKPFGVKAVADFRKSIGGIFAGLLQQDLGAARMFIHPPRDVIDLPIDDQPEVSGARVLPDLVQV